MERIETNVDLARQGNFEPLGTTPFRQAFEAVHHVSQLAGGKGLAQVIGSAFPDGDLPGDMLIVGGHQNEADVRAVRAVAGDSQKIVGGAGRASPMN